MKYVKMFENFDKYNFKTFYGEECEPEFTNMYEHIEDFELSDYEQIMVAIDANWSVKSVSSLNDHLIRFNCNEIYYSTYSLGDYCFSVIKQNSRYGIIVEIQYLDGIGSVSEYIASVSGVINENFSRYEFGPIVTNDVESVFNDMMVYHECLDDADLQYIRSNVDMSILAYLPAPYEYILASSKSFGNLHGLHDVYYYIYSLGDYCYGIVATTRMVRMSIELVDGIVGVVDVLNSKNMKLVKESYDKYNFGKVDKSEDLNSIHDNLALDAIEFEQSEKDLIDVKFNKFEISAVGFEFITIYPPGSSALYCTIYYLGDYIYMVSIVHNRYDAVHELWILDGFDSTMEVLDEIKIKLQIR